GELVERDRVEDHVIAVLLEVQIFFVNGHAAGGQRQSVLARRSGVQCHQYLGFTLARDIAVFAGADGEPRGQPGNVRWEEVLPAHGNAHPEDALQQHAVGGLRARSVHRGYIDGEVVDDARTRTAFALLLTEGQVSSRHVAGVPSENSKAICSASAARRTTLLRCRTISLQYVIIVTSRRRRITLRPKSNPRCPNNHPSSHSGSAGMQLSCFQWDLGTRYLFAGILAARRQGSLDSGSGERGWASCNRPIPQRPPSMSARPTDRDRFRGRRLQRRWPSAGCHAASRDVEAREPRYEPDEPNADDST